MRQKIKIFFSFMLLLRLQDVMAMQEEDERNIFSTKFKLQKIQYEKKYESPHLEKSLSNTNFTFKDLLYKGSARAEKEKPIIMYCNRVINAHNLTNSLFWEFQIKRHNALKSLHEIKIDYKKPPKKIFNKTPLDYIYSQSFNAQVYDYCLREKIYTFSEMAAALSHSLITFNERDLVIFDIDDTLIWFLDPFYIEHVLKNSLLYQECLKSKKNVLCDRSACTNMTIAPSALIEPHSPQLISALQDQSVKAMALTGQPALIFQEESVLINVPKWRVKLLKDREIDFSKSFPRLPPLSWQREMNNDEDKPGPYFEKGILFAGVEGKPISLLNLLHTLSFKPRKVLFIDDILENVLSIYRTLTPLGIECFSVLYTRAKEFSVVNEFSTEEFNSHLKYQEEFIMKKL